MRNKVIAAVVVVALLGGGAWWWMGRRSRLAAANQPEYVFATVKSGPIRSSISGTGPVASVNSVLVKSAQSGTVAQILAQDGDRVKAGQVVTVLQNDGLDASLKQAQLDLQNNQANIDNLLSPQSTAVQAQKLKVDSARLALAQREKDAASLTVTASRDGIVTGVKVSEGSDIAANALLFTMYDDTTPTFTVMVPQQAAAAIAVGQRASVSLPGFGEIEGTVQQNGESASPLTGNRDANVPIAIALPATRGVRPGMVGQASLQVNSLTYLVQGNGAIDNDSVEVRGQVAATVRQIAVKEGDRVKTGNLLMQLSSDNVALQLDQARNDLKVQEQNLTNLVEPASDPNGQLRSLRSKLEQSQITLASRHSDLADLQVKAPVDGQVSSLTPKVGDKVANNQQLFRVADYNMMQITITVDELDIAKAKVGQTALITLDALPGKAYTGKVTKINPEGILKNDIANFEVTITVDNPQGLMAGMNATVSVVIEERHGLYLPSAAVKVLQGRPYVQVLQGDQVVRQDVQIGMRTSEVVEITSGLKDQDRVIQTIIKPQTSGGGLGGLFGGGQRPGQNQGTVPQGQQQPQQQQGGAQNRQNRGTGTGGGGR